MAELVHQAPASPVCVVHEAPASRKSEARTRQVIAVTGLMMVGEIAAGWWTGSLALLADGWHMATHVGALSLTGFAYWYARTRARQTEFAFGTGKVYALAGYSSAALLLVAALAMGFEAVRRLATPEAVDFADALPVAVLGLVVNLLSAWLLGDGVEGGHQHGPAHDHHGHDHHGHDHDHAHEHHHAHDHAKDHGQGHAHGHDENLRAAYLHVVADALTSVMAIAALVVGRWLGWAWADPVVALVGGAVILKWGIGLMRDCAGQLMDLDPSAPSREKIRTALEAHSRVRVVDLHLWCVGPGRSVCVLTVEAPAAHTLDELRALVTRTVSVTHLTLELRPLG
ncbi:MAG: CDF family Co(II)/Ni(II) efflux transporter DmeF [Myxococcaceae bacterium]|nr:CDF family Co(II)/Ni(II) efflux transporter DmeF [Myxococcaceae bacterium]